MTAEALDTEYENGIADILGFLAGDTATVERNVRTQGMKTGARRQIDVRVTGRIFGVENAVMVVDGKRWAPRLDINDVGGFSSFLSDVGADFGLLVTTSGASKTAHRYADNLGGVFIDILSLHELASWRPKGTVNFDYAIPAALYPEAARAVRRAGYRVSQLAVDEWRGLSNHVGLSAFRYLGTQNPSGEAQLEMQNALLAALSRAKVGDPMSTGMAVTAQGGTPSHRWLEVTVLGQRSGLQVLAATEEEISTQLDIVATAGSGSRDELDVIRPAIWPVPPMFSPLS